MSEIAPCVYCGEPSSVEGPRGPMCASCHSAFVGGIEIASRLEEDGEVSEYYRVRMVVSVERCLTTELGSEPGPADWFETKSEVERHGIAMNWHEAEESLADFMAASAVATLMEVCEHSEESAKRELAREFDHRA